jgi:hypothetical protein
MNHLNDRLKTQICTELAKIDFTVEDVLASGNGTDESQPHALVFKAKYKNIQPVALKLNSFVL